MERLPRKNEKHREGVIRTVARLAVRSFTQPFAQHGEHTFPKNHPSPERQAQIDENYRKRQEKLEQDDN